MEASTSSRCEYTGTGHVDCAARLCNWEPTTPHSRPSLQRFRTLYRSADSASSATQLATPSTSTMSRSTGLTPGFCRRLDHADRQKNSGVYGARAVGTGPQWYYLSKTGISLGAPAAASLTYAIRWDALESADDVVAQYTTDGTNWLDAKNYAPAALTPRPSHGQPKPFGTAEHHRRAFRLYADSPTGDALYVDDVSVAPASPGRDSRSVVYERHGVPFGDRHSSLHSAVPNYCCQLPQRRRSDQQLKKPPAVMPV